MLGCGARRGCSWLQKDHGHLSAGLPGEDRSPLAHTVAKSQKDQGEAACSCLDSWGRECVHSVGLRPCS